MKSRLSIQALNSFRPTALEENNSLEMKSHLSTATLCNCLLQMLIDAANDIIYGMPTNLLSEALGTLPFASEALSGSSKMARMLVIITT